VTLVLDASVIIKWLLRDRASETNTGNATDVVEAVIKGQRAAVQPVHWLAEVAGVMSRLSPKTAETDVAMLQALNLTVAEDPAILPRACRLAIRLKHHLFDTLYHAVALESGATLVTADHVYLDKARSLGHITGLDHW